MPHFEIPLNLPHAATIAGRIGYHVARAAQPPAENCRTLFELVGALSELLNPFGVSGENPPEPEASRVRDEAARLGRAIVDEIEDLSLGGDRLGQSIRNLFECLELGEEGAWISLRAGENPDSLQRPV